MSDYDSNRSTDLFNLDLNFDQKDDQNNGLTIQLLKDDNEKLNKRLSLLRDEYVKLQKKYTNLQARYEHLVSSSSLPDIKIEKDFDLSNDQSATDGRPVNFVQKIANFIASLYNNELYSDLVISYQNGEKQLRAHKFVLLFRSDKWSVPDLNKVDQLDFPEMNEDIANALFNWVYTSKISKNFFDKSAEFLFEFIKYAVDFQLKPVVDQCEDALINYIQLENCIYFFQLSEKLGLTRLYDYSAKIVSLHWDSLTAKDFAKVSTEFLHRLFIEKSAYPLHKAITIRNEDLIFLLLMDFNQDAVHKVNEFDNFDRIPLDLALRSGQFSVAKILLEHNANINILDNENWPLAHRYLLDILWPATEFLVENGFQVQNTNPNGDTLLHLCANFDTNENRNKMIQLAQMLIDRHCDVNLRNCSGNTVIHECILMKNSTLFSLLLDQKSKTNLNLEICNNNYETPLLLALNLLNKENDDYFAKKLLSLNVCLDTVNPVTGDSLMIVCARNFNEQGAVFLVENGANINLVNKRGESILHLASLNGLKELVSILMRKNINCNLLTHPLDERKNLSIEKNDGKEIEEDKVVFNQTALHFAIYGGHIDIIKEILSYHDRSSRKGCLDSSLLIPELDIKNSKHQTPLSLSIELNMIAISEMLILSGANINVKNEEGLSLLHSMIINGNIEAAKFLLKHGINIADKCPLTNQSYLQYAIRYQRAPIVELLCKLGADVNELSTNGDCLLWEALKIYKEFGSVEMASILVRFNCDRDGWHQSQECGFYQTLLHRALDQNDQDAAIFLIHSGCDIHCIRKPGPNNEGKEDCDKQTPLHMACSWGMANVVETLLEHNVNANLTDSEGKTALHMAIINQNHPITELLLNYSNCDPYKTDNFGQSPFSLAIKLKSRQSAQALLRRDNSISEQYDGKGRNYFHLALLRNDYDAILFLLDSKIDVNARVKDSTQKAPIHLAAETDSEIILRTLSLAGSEINVLTSQSQTALHIAAELDKYRIVEVLIDLGIDVTVQDNNGNTAFHLAAIRAHHNTCRVFMGYGSSNNETVTYLNQPNYLALDPKLVNNRGHNLIHCLASSANKQTAANIFEELLQTYNDFNLNVQDNEGNTALLLAYMNGNSKLCRSIVKEGASVGIRNNQGISIFNHVMPTKQLLTSLLDSLTQMPAWRDGPECLECGQKFNITNRRHHCRHCGRELCSRCSSKEIIIMKYQQDRKCTQSRVCQPCYDVLTLGVFN